VLHVYSRDFCLTAFDEAHLVVQLILGATICNAFTRLKLKLRVDGAHRTLRWIWEKERALPTYLVLVYESSM
jgi:hypothetical protein